MFDIKKINYKVITLCCVLLSLMITYSYAHIGLLYGILELLLVIFCYVMVLKDLKGPDIYMMVMSSILMFFSVINGIIYTDLKSTFFLSISIMLPLAISVLPVDKKHDGNQFKWGFLTGLTLIFLDNMIGFLGEINSNTRGFYCYMTVAIGFVWYRSSRKIIPLILILIASYIAASTGSRNVAIVILVMIFLLILPDAFFKKKLVYRCIYIAVLFYTIFALNIMEWIFEQDKLAGWLVEYTDSLSDKQWGMESRVYFFRQIEFKLSQMHWYNKLFGEGVLRRHGHNMFYQSLFIYGYIGTLLIYAMLVRVFEMAYKLICENDDKIAIGGFVALIGIVLLNGADVFLIGTETCSVIPQVLMGVIMLRYKNVTKEDRLELVEVL